MESALVAFCACCALLAQPNRGEVASSAQSAAVTACLAFDSTFMTCSILELPLYV